MSNQASNKTMIHSPSLMSVIPGAWKKALIAGAVINLVFVSCAWSADPGKPVEACAGCHGLNGANTESDIPNIGGYSKKYLLGALDAFKSDKRPCPETDYRTGEKKGTKGNMCQIARELDAKDADQIAEHYAAQVFVVTPQQFDSALADKGKNIFAKSCNKCHSIEGVVANDDAGILPGQKTVYLTRQIEQFKEGKRPIFEKMKARFEKLDKTDLDAVIQYLASFK
jgi:cytochrome subunit of sulfide dehydrogenase